MTDQRPRKQAPPSEEETDALIRLYRTGQLGKAEQACHRLLETCPGSRRVLNILGPVLLNQGKLRQAVATYDTLIRLRPDDPQAYNNRGIVFKMLGKLESAIENYEKALSLAPDSAQTHNNYGNALQQTGQLEAALQAFDRAIRLKPDYAEAYNNRGLVLNSLGRTEASIHSYENAISLNPGYAQAYNHLGISLKTAGRPDVAVTAFDNALRIKPDFFEAYQNLSKLKTFRPGDPHLKRMMSFIGKNTLSETDQIHLSFAMGKALSDIGDVAEAFCHYQAANRLRKKRRNYHIDSDRQLFQRISTLFTLDPLHRAGTPGQPPYRPIFILGMPRSGTTLVEQILASHSMVHAAGELRLLTDIIREIPGIFKALTADRLREIRKRYLDGLAGIHPSRTWVTDKMPLNFRWIGFIVSALPEAKIIHVKRQAPATCWSIFTHCFTSGGHGYAHDLDDVAAYYLLYKQLMAFWHRRFPGNLYDLDYETLTRDQEGETRRLLDFIGLDWEAGCLDFHKTRRPVKTASSLQVRKKIYQGSSEKWRTFKHFLTPMLNRLEETHE